MGDNPIQLKFLVRSFILRNCKPLALATEIRAWVAFDLGDDGVIS